MVAESYGEVMIERPARRWEAGAAALAAGCLLAAAFYLLDNGVLAALVLGGGVTIILLVLLGFPEVANRHLGGGERETRAVLGRGRIATGLLGVSIAAAALILDSTLLLLVAVAYFSFWAALVFGRRSARGPGSRA